MAEALNRAIEGAQRLPEAEQDVVAQLLLEKIHAFEVLATYGHDLTALAAQGQLHSIPEARHGNRAHLSNCGAALKE